MPDRIIFSVPGNDIVRQRGTSNDDPEWAIKAKGYGCLHYARGYVVYLQVKKWVKIYIM